jgi:DNA repair exonuclease SbcCD ATPase subunit
MSGTVINPISKKSIGVGKDVFKSLIKQGYTYNPIDNTLTIKQETLTTIIAPTIQNTHIPKNINNSEHVIDEVKKKLPQRKTPDPEDLKIVQIKYDGPEITHIIHMSDIHIPRNLHSNRNDEYNSVFNKTYKEIKDIASKHTIIIVITGDLLHVKLQIEPETLIMTRLFIENLSKIAPTIITLGNHDFAENNRDRIDTITAVSHGLNAHILRKTGVFQIANIAFAFSSLVDLKFIKRKHITPTTLPVYALYHGTVVGSVNCNGTKNKESHNNLYPTPNDFDGYDAVLMGHIHKYQQFSPNMAYAGSLIQQNIGESIDGHGYLLWDIKTNTHTLCEIHNEYAFIYAEINDGQITNIDHLNRHKHKNLTINCKTINTTPSQYKTLEDQLKNEFKVTSIVTRNPLKSTKTITTQNTIEVTPYTLDYEIDIISKECAPKYLQSIIDMHKNLHQLIDSKTPSPYFWWNIISVKFKNVFIYGNDNENYINFVTGVNNVCSPNMTGKSSIVNVVLFALFDKVSTNSTNKSDILNINSNSGYIELNITCNGQSFLIKKTISLMKRDGTYKPLYNTTFERIEDSGTKTLLNGISITKTLSNITSYVGDFESFVRHNSITTKRHTSIIDMSPSDRLKHFHKLCDTNRYQLYHEECKNREAKLIKEYENKKTKFNHIRQTIQGIKIDDIKDTINLYQSNYNQLESDSEKVSSEQKNAIETKSQLVERLKTIENQLSINLNNKQDKEKVFQIYDELTIKEKLETINKTLAQYSTKTLEEVKTHSTLSLNSAIREAKKCLITIEKTPQELENMLDIYQTQYKKLSFSSPIGLEEEVELIKNEALINKHIYDLKSKIDTLDTQLSKYNHINNETPIDVNNKEDLLSQKDSIKAQISQIKANITSCDDTLDDLQLQLNPLCEIIHTSDANESLAVIIHQINQLDNEITTLKKEQMSKPQDETVTIEYLTSQFQPFLQIDTKLPMTFENNQTFSHLKQQLNISESEQKSFNIPSIINIINNAPLSSDNNMISIPSKIAKVIAKILQNVDKNSHILQEYNQLNTIVCHNNKIDNDIKTNNDRKTINEAISQQIAYIKYHKLLSQRYELNNRKENLDKQITKFTLLQRLDKVKSQMELKNKISALELDFEKIKTNLDTIELHQTINEKSLTEKELIKQTTELETVHTKLNWYTETKKLKSMIVDIVQKLESCNNNSEYEQKIKKYEQYTTILRLIWEKEDTENTIKSIDLFQTIKVMLDDIENLTDIISQLDQQLNTFKKELSECSGKIATLIEQQKNYQINNDQINVLGEGIASDEKLLEVYKEYKRLFNEKNIPLKMLDSKMNTFVENVNNIFSSHTKYVFKYTQTNSGKMDFDVLDKVKQLTLEPDRLSGYESIMLQLAINQAIGSISNQSRSGFILIDESLDCIDQTRFVEKLPDIIESIRKYYQTILLISHRDVPTDIIDKQLKIVHNPGDTFSSIQSP